MNFNFSKINFALFCLTLGSFFSQFVFAGVMNRWNENELSFFAREGAALYKVLNIEEQNFNGGFREPSKIKLADWNWLHISCDTFPVTVCTLNWDRFGLIKGKKFMITPTMTGGKPACLKDLMLVSSEIEVHCENNTMTIERF